MKILRYAVILLGLAAGAAESKYDVAVKLLNQKQYDAAKTLLEAEAKASPKSVKIRFALGYACEKLDQTQPAVRHYARAVVLNLETGRDADEAGKAIQRIVKIEPGVAPVFSHATALMKEAENSPKHKKFIRGAAVLLLQYGLDDTKWNTQVAPAVKVRAPDDQTLSEKELEKNLGYNLGWAPRDAVEGPNGHKYKYFAEKVTWEEARKRCEKAGGFLTTITSAEKEKFLKELSRESNRSWAGGSDVEKEGQWVWITGEPMTYSNWCANEPDNHRGKQHYMLLSSAGWWDAGSTATSGYICEWVK